MSDFVRVRLAGVGEWSQSVDHPVPTGAEILDQPAVDAAGQVIAQIPDPPDAEPVKREPFFAAEQQGSPLPDGDPTAAVPDLVPGDATQGAPAPAPKTKPKEA